MLWRDSINWQDFLGKLKNSIAMQMKKFNLKSNSARIIKLTQNPYRKLIGQ